MSSFSYYVRLTFSSAFEVMLFCVFTRGCRNLSANTNRTLFAYDSPSTRHHDRQEQLAPQFRRTNQRSQWRVGKLHKNPQRQENRVAAVEQQGREQAQQAGRRKKNLLLPLNHVTAGHFGQKGARGRAPNLHFRSWASE